MRLARELARQPPTSTSSRLMAAQPAKICPPAAQNGNACSEHNDVTTPASDFARLFGRQSWLADRETCSALHRKLIQMGLVEVVCVEPQTWRSSPLGKELDVDLPALENAGVLRRS